MRRVRFKGEAPAREFIVTKRIGDIDVLTVRVRNASPDQIPTISFCPG